jgi:hypothetical protein
MRNTMVTSTGWLGDDGETADRMAKTSRGRLGKRCTMRSIHPFERLAQVKATTIMRYMRLLEERAEEL